MNLSVLNRIQLNGFDLFLEPEPRAEDYLIVYAKNRQQLVDVLNSIELAGMADGKSLYHLIIEDTDEPGYPYKVGMSKSTFNLFFEFELLNYFGKEFPSEEQV